MTSAIVSWTQLPTANDVVDGPILAANIICENTALVAVTSGGSYPVGTTTVTCKASDTALNEGVCSFDVAVEGRFVTLFLSFCKVFCLRFN